MIYHCCRCDGWKDNDKDLATFTKEGVICEGCINLIEDENDVKNNELPVTRAGKREEPPARVSGRNG